MPRASAMTFSRLPAHHSSRDLQTRQRRHADNKHGKLQALADRQPPPKQRIPQNSYNCSYPAVLKIPLKIMDRIVIRFSTKIEWFVANRNPIPVFVDKFLFGHMFGHMSLLTVKQTKANT